MNNSKKNINSFGDFIDFFETSAILIDTKDFILRYNDKLKAENEILEFFKFGKDEKTYVLSNIDKEDWYKYLRICFTNGAAKFILKSCFYECVMTRLHTGQEHYALVNFFENKSLKEDVADFFHNDFRLSQLKELSEMAASIAHEINNPLTVITARTQLLKQSIKENKVISPETLLQNLEKIYLQSDRIKKIVDGMRVFSRNSVQDNLTVYNIKSIVEEAQSLVSGSMRDNGIEFKFDLSQNEKYVNCKPNELIQVFVNLFNNSIYALSKTVFPKIEVQFIEDETCFHLYFSDNGPGIPQEYESKIFAPFFTTKPVGAGTGLGLSISNKILQSYGGSLTLDRSRGNSCFHIVLSKIQDHKQTGNDAKIFKFSS